MSQPEVFAVFNKSFNRQNEVMDKLVELLDKNGGLAKLDAILAKLQMVDVLTEEVKSMSAKITSLTDSLINTVSDLNDTQNNEVAKLTETITALNSKVDEAVAKINDLDDKYVKQLSIEEHKQLKEIHKKTTIFDLDLQCGRLCYCTKTQKIFYLIDFIGAYKDKVVEYFKLTENDVGDGHWYYSDIDTYYNNTFAITEEIYNEKISFLNLPIALTRNLNGIACYARDNMVSMEVKNDKYYVKMQPDTRPILLQGLKQHNFCDENPIDNIAIMNKRQYMRLMSD